MELKDIKDNNYLAELGLKAEKLTSAIYLITSLIPDAEPLKWRLREKSLNFLSDIKNLKTLIPHPENLSDSLQEILLLIEVALSSNLFSRMNFSIMRDEYRQLKLALEKESHTPLLPTNSIPRVHPPITISKTLPAKQGSLAVSDRKKLILGFIQGKGWSSIKDVSEAVSGFSTKTIQRELVQLVDQGLLKREGDRRWSRYGVIDS